MADLETRAFPHGWKLEALRSTLESNTGIGWLMAGDGSAPPAAYALFQLVLDEAELLRIAVAPEFQGQGLGSHLLCQALHRLSDRGVVVCRLEVSSDNDAAIALYRRFGFIESGRREAYYRDGNDALLMQLQPLGSRAH